MAYTNPVVPGFNPDPSITRAGGDYYLATSSFEYFPGVPLYHSTDLANWEPIGHALTRDSQLPLDDAGASEGVFAPTLREHDGTFYLVTTNVSAGGHFLVTADDPESEWSDPTWVEGSGIDPDLFWDDGTPYFTYRAGREGIVSAEIDLETGELGEKHELGKQFAADYTEAPHLYERDGTYYLVVAEGGTHTGHAVCVARADSPRGPFEGHPDNPVLSHRGVSEMYTSIQATGHGDLVRTPEGEWWMVFLGVRQHGGYPGWHHLGRETFLAPVEWEDGWPVVNGGERIETEMKVERGLETTAEWETEGFGDELGPEWNYRYNPERERYDLSDGTLTLRGGPETLAEPGCTFVGRRQQHLSAEAETTLESAGDGEAGLAVFYDGDHHFALGVEDGEALLRLRIGDATETVAREPVEEPVDLRVGADADEYRFFADGIELGAARSKYVATETAGGFTGVYLALYATGRGEETSEPAAFSAFSYGER